jgi:hypothetical protein
MNSTIGRVHKYKGIRSNVVKDFYFLSKALSKDDFRQFLTVAKVCGDWIHATDGRRIHSIKNFLKLPDQRILYILESTKTKLMFIESKHMPSNTEFPNIDSRIYSQRPKNILFTIDAAARNLALNVYKLNHDFDIVSNIKYVTDLCSADERFSVYCEGSDRAVYFENEQKKAVIMQISKIDC